MKITEEDYQLLVAEVGPFMPPNATERQRWDALWESGVKPYSPLANGIRMYDYMNDCHIDTALKRISAMLN
ncbi:hypothetical protein LCGC14_1614340, partial [marine sediment metagenome]